MKLGDRIHKLRVRQRMTLKQVSVSCGVTTSMLSKIENDKALPSVAALTRIAAALGTPMSALLDSEAGGTTVVSRAKQEGGEWTSTDKGYRFRGLFAERVEKIMQPLLFLAEKKSMRGGALRHTGEEFVFVLQGRMSYRVGDVTHELAPGDGLYFDAEDPHDLRPITATVKYLAVFAERPLAPKSSRRARLASRQGRKG